MCEVVVSDAKSVLPWVALSGVTGTGASTSVDLGGVSNEFTMNLVITGSPSSLDVRLQGSHDDVNWFTILESTTTGSHPLSTEFTLGEETTGTPDRRYRPHARYVRAIVNTLSGGSSPTVTASIAVGRVI